MSSISLVSLNVERSKHLDLVIPFLKEKKPDVVTLQECMECDIPPYENALDAKCFFTPLNFFASRPNEKEGVEGTAIFAKEFISTGEAYYWGQRDPLPQHTEDRLESVLRISKAISHVEVQKDGVKFSI